MRKRFVRLCDSCAEKEDEVASRIKTEGIHVLAEHYVPDTECLACVVGTWKDLGSRLSSLGASLFLAVLGLGASAKFANCGLIFVTSSELVLVTLDENLAGKDFDWTDMNAMAVPAHYSKGSGGIIHAKVKRAPLSSVSATYERVDGGHVLNVTGAISCRAVIPSSWHPANDATVPAVMHFATVGSV
jgi:hypothetical protein